MITLFTLWQATWIILGMWFDAKLAWMCYYEFKNSGDGEKYLRGELFPIKTQKQEIIITETITKIINFNMKIIKIFVKIIKNRDDL